MLYFNCWDVKNASSPDPVISGWTKLTYTRVTGTPDKWLLNPYSSRASFLFKSNHVTSLLKTLQRLLFTLGIKSKVLPRAPSRSLRDSLLPSLPLSHSLTPSWQFLQRASFLSSLPQHSRLLEFRLQLPFPAFPAWLSPWLDSPSARSLPRPFYENSPPSTNPACTLSPLSRF